MATGKENLKSVILGNLKSQIPCRSNSLILPFPNCNRRVSAAAATRSRRFTVNCTDRAGEEPAPPPPPLSASSPYAVLGVDSSCSADELKAAFRAKVKQFHPDVNKAGDSDAMIRRIIQAYELYTICHNAKTMSGGQEPILSNYSRSQIIESECLDPFEKPECEAFDLFVNEVRCVGKGCPYSCVKRAPHAFQYGPTGTAQAISQGHFEDYEVQLAVGQCPTNCINYVTPSQRIILEELLDSILNAPYDVSAEADLLYSLIVKARFENNRYQKPKKQPKSSSQHVDWF